MKKNGYTLIELIVVIVVLVIIGAITLPIILTKINNSRYERAKASAYETINAVKLYHYNKLVSNNGVFEEITFTCNKKCKYLDEQIEVNTNPSSGKITVGADGTIKGDISFYEGDYTFYICDGILFDEKISICSSSNKTTLDKNDYEEGSEVIYAGLMWNVIKDNGDNTTLILKNVIDYASLGNKSYDYEKSDVNSRLKEWFDNNLTLRNAKEQEKLISMSFSDGNKDYDEYIRIPSKEDVGITKNSSKCVKKWCNIGIGYWLIDYVKNSESIYKVYNIGKDGDAYTIDVSNESGIRPVIIVKEH